MRRLLTGLAGMIVAFFIVIPLLAEDTAAQVRFNAVLKTPDIQIRAGNDSYRHRGNVRIYHGQIRPGRSAPAVYEDRKIAFRLAAWSGIRERKLIRMRRHGYRWAQIGRFYNIPPGVVRAAMDQRQWNRFLEKEMRITGNSHGRGRRVAVVKGR
ncbi:MAG: hypothetical protein JW814_01570 [Candidatus Krumholzibacteriota bacterium]|nr:hypothetical protein [Candidatus Krumholzibacteriota bacterium]